MATLDELARAGQIERLIDALALKRTDIGKLSPHRYAESLKALPPPNRIMTDAEVRAMLEPKPVKWHKDLIPDFRTTSAPETIPYYRYSTDMQEHSIEHQRDIVAEFYELRAAAFRLPPLVVDKEFADPETSGKKDFLTRRWSGQLACYVRPGDHVVFAYFDRIGRKACDTLAALQKFMEMGVFVHVIDHAQFQFCDPSHPSTIKQIQEAATAAEFERGMIAKRTGRASQNHLTRGRVMGHQNVRCYRQRPNPDYVPGVRDSMENPLYLAEFCPAEAALCEIIYHAWAVDGWVVAEISAALRHRAKRDKRFLRAQTGKPWTRDGIKKVIRKLHGERCRGGAAGVFLTAALNGNGGAN